MRVVILTNGQSNQMVLAHRIRSVADVAAVVVSKNIPRLKPRLSKTLRLRLNAVAGRTVGKPLVNAWKGMLEEYDREVSEFPARIIEVRNVNDEATIETLAAEKPDLVVVSGTNLVGSKVIAAARDLGGIVNLHTGISPYVRGGPNCTNWCLANGWFDLIGNTVMWLDRGIDTGDLIATERTELDGSESLVRLHRKVMDHGHSLYVRALARIAQGAEVPSVTQGMIATGHHFNSVDWTAGQMARAIRNFRTSYKSFFSDPRPDTTRNGDIQLFPLRDA